MYNVNGSKIPRNLQIEHILHYTTSRKKKKQGQGQVHCTLILHHEGNELGGRPTNPENALSLLNGANPNLGFPRSSTPSPLVVDGNVVAAV